MLKRLACLGALALGALVYSPARAFDENRFCQMAKTAADRGRADIGVMLDQITRNDGMAVLCGHRMIDFKKFMMTSESSMREGWRERKRRQWNEIYCQNEAWLGAIRAGWTVAMTMTFQDGTRVFFTADCRT